MVASVQRDHRCSMEMFVIVALLSASWILTCMSIISYRRMAAPKGVHAIVLISVLLTAVATSIYLTIGLLTKPV